MKPYVDKLMGGRLRDKDEVNISVDAGAITKQYIQDLINNSTFDWSQITGSVTNNQELKSYINSLLDLFALNQFNIGDTITQEMLDYFQSILDQLTITSEQITDLDTINQAFKTYIDNQIAELTSYIQQLVIDEIYSAELKQYIDDSIANLQTILEQLIKNTVNNEIQQYIEQVTNNNGEATRLISGTVTWLHDLTFWVSPLVYQILNQRIESAEIEITIPANVSNDPMFALIVADVFGNISFIQGVPAPAPSIPLVNSSTQIIIQTVYIPALGTEPGNDPGGETTDIVTETIYDENIEWQTAKTEEANVSIDLDAVTEPKKGAKHIKLAILGGAASPVRSVLDQQPMEFDERLVYVGADPVDFNIDVDNLYPDHKTDFIIDQVRHLVFYNFKSFRDITATLYSKNNNTTYRLIPVDFVKENFTVAELGFSVSIIKNVTFAFKNEVPTEGDYILKVAKGFIRNDQQYIVTTVNSLQPVNAAISFTRNEAIEAKGGKISLSLKTFEAWLNNTGLLFELYNGAVMTGTLAMIPANYRGYNPSNTEYQRITLPVENFNPTDTKITKLMIRPVNQWPVNSNLLIDDVIIQTGGQAVELGKVEEISFEFRDITEAGQIYELDMSAYYKYKVLGATLKTDTGEINALISINAQPITGLNCNVTNIKQHFNATNDNHVVIDDLLKMTIVSIANDVTSIIGKIKLVRE